VVNEEERVRALVESAEVPLVVADADRHVIASNVPGFAAGRRIGEVEGALVLFMADAPELSAYQELRAGFTAAVSHELRTPLARLMVLLESANLPGSNIDDLLEQARLEVEQARELIDDVLFLGELETGREVVSLGSTPAMPIVREVVAALHDRAENSEVSLVVRGSNDVELPLRPRMLRVVVENLISNSLRYAGPGTTCTVELGDRRLVVADNGAGVSPEALPRLFERFYRADSARSTRGTGLGLAIVKHIVTSAGGTVDAIGTDGLTVVCTFD
jgi:two-component system, OmpR family, phosphate regulon sensor histidine kinase PhoR